MNYDYLIVGAGLYGAVCAHELHKKGKRVLVIDRRPHIAGNSYTESKCGIHVHKYGAHIFHTSSREVWDYVNRFAEFNHYVNSPVARYRDELYNLPFNMNTFYAMWKVKTPHEAREIIDRQRREAQIEHPSNLEEQAISLVGVDVYEKLVKGYTMKQWGRECRDLPAFIIKRLPLRFTFDNNYFNDRYQGIPIEGYTAMVSRMLAGVEVLLNTEYRAFIGYTGHRFDRIIYTGAIDEFFDYSLGELAYRSLRFEEELLEGCDNYQGNAVVNYTEAKIPYTRIIEHKHFTFGQQPDTVISREYPAPWEKGGECYYPMNDEKNNALYESYRELGKAEPNVIFGGRLGSYQYYDMDKVIAEALTLTQDL